MHNPPSLLLDLYELTMAQSYFEHKFTTRATFDLFVRKLPQNRSYLLFCGLEDAIKYLTGIKFSGDDLSYLKSLNIFSEDFLNYLKKFRFCGDVYALREGEIFFANEPVLRVTANIIEAQIVESFLLNIINLQTMIASKASRIAVVSKGRGLYDFSLRRTHGKDAAIKVARSCFIAGFKGTSNVLAAKHYNLPCVGTMAHSFIMAFGSELESFRAFAKTFPRRTILLVDTYDSVKGTCNAIIIAKELEKKGFKLKGIRLDSGDLAGLSKTARRLLNNAGLNYVRIFASGNLDEYKINEIIKKGAQIDDFGVGTNMGTSNDAPFLDVIYKISEVTNSKGDFLPAMKLSKGKITYPGRKQIYRFGKNGFYSSDLVALEGEEIKDAMPLLRQVIKQGKAIYKFPSLSEIQNFASENLSKLPKHYKDLENKNRYLVKISPGLKKISDKLRLTLAAKSKLAFFDIDTQFDFMNPKGKLFVKDSPKIVNNLKRLTKFAQKNNITILSSQDAHAVNDPEFKVFPAHCVEDTAGQEKISGTKIKNSVFVEMKELGRGKIDFLLNKFKQVIIKKNTYTVFANPNTKKLISKFDKFYVYGVALDYCVRACCLELRKYKKETFLVIDSVKEVNPESREKVIAELRQKGVQFIKTSEITKGVA